MESKKLPQSTRFENIPTTPDTYLQWLPHQLGPSIWDTFQTDARHNRTVTTVLEAQRVTLRTESELPPHPRLTTALDLLEASSENSVLLVREINLPLICYLGARFQISPAFFAQFICKRTDADDSRSTLLIEALQQRPAIASHGAWWHVDGFTHKDGEEKWLKFGQARVVLMNAGLEHHVKLFRPELEIKDTPIKLQHLSQFMRVSFCKLNKSLHLCLIETMERSWRAPTETWLPKQDAGLSFFVDASPSIPPRFGFCDPAYSGSLLPYDGWGQFLPIFQRTDFATILCQRDITTSSAQAKEMAELFVLLLSHATISENLDYLAEKARDLARDAITHGGMAQLRLLSAYYARIATMRDRMRRDWQLRVRTDLTERLEKIYATGSSQTSIHQTLSSQVDDLDQQATALLRRLDEILQLIVAGITVQQGERSLEFAHAANTLTRQTTTLTVLAVIYLPLSLTTGVFGMNVIPDGTRVWWVVVVLFALLGLTGVLFLLALWLGSRDWWQKVVRIRVTRSEIKEG